MRSPLPLFAAILALGALPALAGCSREEEPVANRFERQKAEIENKARAFEAQVENDVSAAEARLQNEVDVLMQNQAPPAEGNAAESNSSR
jgi:hypothetical protein